MALGQGAFGEPLGGWVLKAFEPMFAFLFPQPDWPPPAVWVMSWSPGRRWAAFLPEALKKARPNVFLFVLSTRFRIPRQRNDTEKETNRNHSCYVAHQLHDVGKLLTPLSFICEGEERWALHCLPELCAAIWSKHWVVNNFIPLRCEAASCFD